ncbi:MAG: SIMPL domain-containing protein [Pseudomonadota bacterium]
MRVFGLLAVLVMATGVWAEDAQVTPGVISVSGEGRVSAVPDMAVIQIGVEETARSAGLALDAVATSLARILETADANGVAPRDVQSQAINVSARYDRNARPEPVLTGYVAFSSLSLKVRDLDALGALLDAMVSDGANRMNGLSLTVAEPAPLRDQARRLAVADARRKADLYAEAAGVAVGRLLVLSDGARSVPMPQQRFAMAEAAVMDMPVAAGEVDIVQTVTMQFEIEQ